MKKVLAFVLLMFSLGAARAQVAGMSALSVLDMPASAQAAGMGFDFLSLYGADLPVALGNPSLIGEGLNNKLALGFVNVFAGSNFGSAAYGHTFKGIGTPPSASSSAAMGVLRVTTRTTSPQVPSRLRTM